jgi:outer membrane lipoprotein-sorting protein
MKKFLVLIYTIILYSIVSCIIPADAFSETYTVESVFASLRAKYSSMKTVELEFQSVEPVSGMVGLLQAEKSGKYVLTLNDRKIICDNHTIWNIIPNRKMVSISSLKSKPTTSIDIILFTFLYSYQPISIKEYSVGKNNLLALELHPKGQSSAMGIKKLRVFLKKGSTIIERISADDGNQDMVWDIKKLTINSKLQSDLFTYTPPVGMEIIDMR